MDYNRPQFKPSRPRASMSSLPSTSSSSFLGGQTKENRPTLAPASSPGSRPKKRAQSLGGDALEAARKAAKTNVFGQAREKMAPRKSILRAQGAIFEGTNDPTFDFSHKPRFDNHTIDLGSLSASQQARPNSVARRSLGGAQQPPMHDDSSEEESDEDMDITMSDEQREREARRKSLAARRVSFAPNAHIRTFTPDKRTAQAQAALAAQKAAMHALGGDLPFSPGSDSGSSSHSNEESMKEGESMEMVGEEITRAFGAFANHFAGTVIPADVLTSQDDVEEEEEEQSFADSNGSLDMDEATGEITRAFAAQGPNIIFNSQPPQTEDVRAKPRFSEVVRQEDAEDEELMRELGLVKPVRVITTAPKNVGFGGVPPSSEDESEEGESIDDGVTMDMTTALGEVLQSAEAPAQEEDEEEEDDSDESMMDQTTDMQDATTYGGILGSTQVFDQPADSGVAAPSTTSARLQAALFARQSEGGSAPLGSTITVPEPPRSPRRLSPSPQPQSAPAQAPAPPKSPARSRPSLAPPKSPAQPKISSPLKASYVPSSDSAAPSTPPQPVTAPTTPAKSPRVVSRPVTTPRSVARTGPVTPKSATKVAFGTAITPRNVFTPKVMAPPLSAGRSPGGSLSLRAAMSAPSPRKSLAAPAPAPVVMAPAAIVVPRVSEMIKAEVRAEDEEDEDMTSSSYGFGAEPVELAPLTLDEFLGEAGVDFQKNLPGATGLHKLRRMSLAPSRQLSGPPSFADLAVAGGCKSLLHQLYTANQLTLEDKIRQTTADQEAWEEVMLAEPPQVFDEWQRASDAHREVMKAQFRAIKMFYSTRERLEWNEYRRDNYESIIEIMEENLAGLARDNALVEELRMEDVLPELEARRAQLHAELLEERARDLELSACDQDQLKESHAEVAELAAIADKYEAEREELEGQLATLRGKVSDLKGTQEGMVREAEEMQRKLDEGRVFTKAEVFRLQGEFEALQDLHAWNLLRFDGQGVTLSHYGQFEISAQLAAGGLVQSVELRLLQGNKSRVLSPPALAQLEASLTAFLFSKLALHVENSLEGQQKPHVKALLHRVAALWTNARRIKSEASRAHLRHPIVFQPVGLPDRNQEAILHAEVHSAQLGATVFVKFELTGEELIAEEGAHESLNPAAEEDVLGGVGSEVKVKFARGGGPLDTETLKYLVRERLDAGERGAFVRACDDVEGRMAQWAARA